MLFAVGRELCSIFLEAVHVQHRHVSRCAVVATHPVANELAVFGAIAEPISAGDAAHVHLDLRLARDGEYPKHRRDKRDISCSHVLTSQIALLLADRDYWLIAFCRPVITFSCRW